MAKGSNMTTLLFLFLLIAAAKLSYAAGDALGTPSTLLPPQKDVGPAPGGGLNDAKATWESAAAGAAPVKDSAKESAPAAADSPASLRNFGGQSLPLGPSRGLSGPPLSAVPPYYRQQRGAADAVCSIGLRLAFDCALRRVIAFGVRDHLIEKYKLPMVALDLCQSEILLDVEQCIPVEFTDLFPSDTFIEVVRNKRLLVGTMDFSVFPQLASDQGYTSGFYPELVQAVVRELTVIALQNPGLRRELVGDRELNISILDQPFSKRLKDVKAAVAQELFWNAACNENARGPHSLQHARAAAGLNDTLGGDGSLPWHDGMMCGETSGSSSSCLLLGCLSPWRDIPKDILIGVTHVKFSTPMNLVAAVHRGEVHMTDVGTIASAYLPEKYNFLPLREVLEPSCTIGAWKSFFLMRDPWSRRRRDRRHSTAGQERRKSARAATEAFQTDAGATTSPLNTNTGNSNLERSPSGFSSMSMTPADMDRERRPSGSSFWGETQQHMESGEGLQSWEERMQQTRRLFFKLYGVQTESSPTANNSSSSSSSSSQQSPANGVGTAGANAVNTSRNADTDTAAFEEKTLVKLQAVDHFLFSYLFPEDFRIYSVRKLTDLSSVLSDGEPVGAFGYGLAGRGGRRRISSASAWRCHAQQRRGPSSLIGSRFRREPMVPRMAAGLRPAGACDLQATYARQAGRQYDGVVEFPGPLVPLAAFFAKSRDPTCRGLPRRPVRAVAEKQAALGAAASMPSPLLSVHWYLCSVGALVAILFAFF
ncbi:uncharacterized protein EMH_0060570 [Eimeria mitis]|uniref:Uncharacterized protein n=1 Tax=Eimeria mitis TaxID=44415 RepID=U6K818_9EIME|nr:uncharacterized protein EMH_0060570 [Eimeria mitis]CDJ34160.1 hypothetical protein, conserved [Eimeria mitis]